MFVCVWSLRAGVGGCVQALLCVSVLFVCGLCRRALAVVGAGGKRLTRDALGARRPRNEYWLNLQRRTPLRPRCSCSGADLTCQR